MVPVGPSVGLAIQFNGAEELIIGTTNSLLLPSVNKSGAVRYRKMINSVNEIPGLPDGLLLRQNNPKPGYFSHDHFWQLPEKAHVILKVCDFMGRR